MCTVQRNILYARRWLSLFLVCCFVLCGLGGIHQRAQAIVGVDDALIAIVIAGLAAVGISFVTHGAYNSLSDYMGSLLEEYALSRQLAPAELFVGTQSAVNSAGQILMNNRFIMLIQGFGAWLKAKFNLTDNSTINVVSSDATLNGMTMYSLPLVLAASDAQNWNISYTIVTGNGNAIIMKETSTSAKIAVVSDAPATIHFENNYQGTIMNQSNKNLELYPSGLYFAEVGTGLTISRFVNGMTMYNKADVMAAVNGDASITDGDVPIDIQVGAIDLPEDSIDYQSGYFGIINVNAPWASSIGQVTDVAIPADYQFGKAGDADISYAPAADVTGQIDAAASQPISTSPGDYQTPGLENVFPFCIPFDIYNLLSALAADPVAPSFTWRFYVPRVCDETFTVDLSPFDTVAQIVRTVELLAFIVGLAMVTRERFLRG